MELSKSLFVQRKANHDHHTERGARRYRLPAVLPSAPQCASYTHEGLGHADLRLEPPHPMAGVVNGDGLVSSCSGIRLYT